MVAGGDPNVILTHFSQVWSPPTEYKWKNKREIVNYNAK